jgi:hypothetical protein
MPVDYKWSDLVVRLYAIRSQRCAGSFTVLDRGLIAEHVVTVTGKAFYDITHEPADHSNRRHSPKDYAVWEIHLVMKLEVVQ